jgi:exonuclease 3'-5' domain-containing protein 1
MPLFSSPSFMLVDTEDQLRYCLQALCSDLGVVNEMDLATPFGLNPLPERERILACDFEGLRLSRAGELCVGQFATTCHTFVIDFVLLGRAAVDTTVGGISLKMILQSPAVPKLMFDPRCDSDAIFHQFGVLLNGVICLQILDIAVRRSQSQFVEYNRGLNAMLATYRVDGIDNVEMNRIKEEGKAMFNANIELWKIRPLPDLLVRYSELDVESLFPLYRSFLSNISGYSYWIKKVLEQSQKRVSVCHDPKFLPSLSSHRFAPQF